VIKAKWEHPVFEAQQVLQVARETLEPQEQLVSKVSEDTPVKEEVLSEHQASLDFQEHEVPEEEADLLVLQDHQEQYKG